MPVSKKRKNRKDRNHKLESSRFQLKKGIKMNRKQSATNDPEMIQNLIDLLKKNDGKLLLDNSSIKI